MEEDIESLDKQSLAFYELPLEPNNDKIIVACLCFELQNEIGAVT